jgi:uncharacterized protein YecE (DUF72 family)
MSNWYLGTIGFSYKDWVGGFYPTGTTQAGYLPYYCKIFNSLELDTTFHSIPHPATVQSWVKNTPDDFIFCVKTPRAITHDRNLRGTQGIMAEFLSALAPFKTKLGPILVQLPPSFSQDHYSFFTSFLEDLPASHQYAIEFRHPSWYNDKTRRLLARYGVCWATIDYPNLPRQIYPTTDFLYFRWIGVNGMFRYHSYERLDKTQQLKTWLQAIQPYLAQVANIYGYFNNDYAGFAAGTCQRLMQLLGITPNQSDTPYQERLF